MDDSELVARVRSGEREAFHALLERHSAGLLATLVSFLAHREDAREVFQEAWLRAYRHLGRLRDPGRFRPWLVTIALNLARARRRRAPELPLEEETASRVDDELPAGEDERARLRAELAALPARQREVVDLRVNHELSHTEIAAALGITEEASRASFYQGLKRLRRSLGRQGCEER